MKDPSFTLTPRKWCLRTNAIGIVAKRGEGGRTTAHPDIAMDFNMWVESGLRLTLINRFREACKSETKMNY
jgi:hypothetical protein